MIFKYFEIETFPNTVYSNIEIESLINSMLIDYNIRPAYWIIHIYARKKGINHKYIDIVKKYIPDVNIYYGKMIHETSMDTPRDCILIHKQDIKEKLLDNKKLGTLLGYTCVEEYIKNENNKYNPMLLCKIKYNEKEFYIFLFAYVCNTLNNAKKGKKFETNANKVLDSINEKYHKVFKHYKFEIIEFLFIINHW